MTQPTVTFWLCSSPVAGDNPHRHDAFRDGRCGRAFNLFAIRDGVPEHAGWLEDRFTARSTEDAAWSWGLGAIVATTAGAAEALAAEALGDAFRGFVK